MVLTIKLRLKNKMVTLKRLRLKVNPVVRVVMVARVALVVWAALAVALL
jgi:hypothetical protein